MATRVYAVHEIHRRVDGKAVVVAPGSRFTVEDDEFTVLANLGAISIKKPAFALKPGEVEEPEGAPVVDTVTTADDGEEEVVTVRRRKAAPAA